MQRFLSLTRSLIFVVIFTLISATLNIQAAPLPQTAGPDFGSPRDRNAENLPHLPGATAQSDSSTSPTAVAIYPWSRLAFQSYRDNNWEIYTGNDDGSGQTRLTFDGSSDVHPRLNRGATRIVFASRRTGNYEIYTMNVDGTGLTRLTYNNADDIMPYWSPDGSKIAFQSYRDGQAEVYVMNANGSGQTRLTTNSDYDGEPAWSPDGAKIAFVSKRSSASSAYFIWVMNADGSHQTQVTAQDYSEGPVWSPDGTKIAYDAAGSDGWQKLWVVNADGSNPHVVYDAGSYVDAWARSWSPDGRYIAFTHIYYTVYNNQLYWTYAYLDAWDSTTNNVVRLSYNGADWRPDWQSTDVVAPSSSVYALRTVSPSPFTVRWSGSDLGGSGLQSFDIQVKDGANGTWTTWQSATTATSAAYPGVGGNTYYFRSRARDNAGNVENWPASYDAVTTVESLPPISTVEPLPPFSKDSVAVTWSGNDPGGSGIQTYDVQYRDVTASGSWTAWQTGVSTTIASFVGTTGHTYAFRSRALDWAQNQEAWRSDNGDTQTTFYAWAIGGHAHDNTGTPLVGVNVTTVPQAQGVFATDLSGQYAAYVITSSNTYTASWTKNGYGSLPATAFNASTNLALLYQGTIPAQGNVVTVNGLTVGQTYRIVISGTFQFSIGGGSWADAQWTTWQCPSMVLCTYFKAVSFNGVQLAAQNGQNAVDPNHEYTFLWTADAPQLQMFIVDSDYRDNSGYLAYQIFSTTPDASLDIYLPPADNMIQNGDFEVGDLTAGGWITTGTITPVVTSTLRHTGRQSVLLGTTTLSQTGDSAIAQTVTIPLTMSTPILSFLYKSEGNTFDVRVDNGMITTTVFTTALGTADWTHKWLDLSNWKGQTITVAFTLNQNTEGLPTGVYLDEVSLGSGHPDVWVQLANPPVARPGSTVTYQLTYGNQGGALASNVQLTATLPAQLTLAGASISPTLAANALVWDLGDLPAQSGPNTILITATATPTITGITVVSTTVNIATTTTELEMANNAQQTSLTIKYDVFLPIIALE